MMVLTFRVAESVYAVEARRIVEVVPRVEFRPLPHAPEYLVGLFHYRGSIAPVIDIGLLMGASACLDRLSTRVILVEVPGRERKKSLMGLLAEHVDELKEVAGAGEVFPAMHLEQAPYLGAILQAEGLLVQLIEVERVLPESMRGALFGGESEGA